MAVRSSSLACFPGYNSLSAEFNANLFPGDFPEIVIFFRYFYSHQKFFG